jgi:hypothetical protein
LEFYRQRRRAEVQKLRDNMASFQDAEEDKVLAFLDNKIDKRIKQITYITTTLTKSRDLANVNKYEYSIYGDTVERQVSDDFRRGRKNLSRSHQQSDRTVAIIKKNEAEIRKENERLEQRLKLARTDEDRVAIKDLIDRNNERLAKQKEELMKLARGHGPSGKALGRRDAFDTQKWVERMAEEVVREHRELVRMASESKQDLLALDNWKRRLKKAEAYMAAKEKQKAEAPSTPGPTDN